MCRSAASRAQAVNENQVCPLPLPRGPNAR